MNASVDLLRPERYAPFAFGEDDARQGLVGWMHAHWIIAGTLARRARRAPLDALFMPYWLVDAYAIAHWEGAARRGIVEMGFRELPVCADALADAALLEALEPWPLRSMRPYDPDVVAGRAVGRVLLGRADALALARARMERELKATALRGASTRERERLRLADPEYPRLSAALALLPLWRVEGIRRGRSWTVAMNGATGKVAAAEARSG